MIEQRFGQPVRYSKDCDALAAHISQMCKTTISPSTLRRLMGFVENNKQTPRVYTLDIIADYIGHESWQNLLASFSKEEVGKSIRIEKLAPGDIRKDETVLLSYEPGKQIGLRKVGAVFLVTSSNERKIQVGDEVKFRLAEIHYPLTFSEIWRKGNNLGKVQVATVSGVTGIRKE